MKPRTRKTRKVEPSKEEAPDVAALDEQEKKSRGDELPAERVGGTDDEGLDQQPESADESGSWGE